MKKQVLGVLAVAGVLFVAGLAPARAQEDPGLVKVPFPFIVNGSVVPAGTYRIQPQSTDESVMQLTSLTGNVALAVVTNSGDFVPEQANATLAFKKVGTHYFLAEVRLPGANVREIPLTPKIVASELAKVEAASDHTTNGGVQ